MINSDEWSSRLKQLDVSLCLRLGMGFLFVIGGYSKLSQLLDAERTANIVASYTGTTGYINEFFMQYLFSNGSPLTPWGFLTALSTFELISGVALILGILVRPLALFYAFLLWTFVFSLPVVTTPGVELTVKTYTSPAMFVQIRDIALSGLMFVLYLSGSGKMAMDAYFLKESAMKSNVDWEMRGLLLRLSLAIPLLIGGLFGAFPKIATFGTPSIILFIAAVWLLSGIQSKKAGALIAAIMVWFMMTKLTLDKSIIANLNGFKREFGFLSAAIIVVAFGTGTSYTPADLWRRAVGSLKGMPEREPLRTDS